MQEICFGILQMLKAVLVNLFHFKSFYQNIKNAFSLKNTHSIKKSIYLPVKTTLPSEDASSLICFSLSN